MLQNSSNKFFPDSEIQNLGWASRMRSQRISWKKRIFQMKALKKNFNGWLLNKQQQTNLQENGNS